MSGTRNTNIHSNHTVLSLDKHSGHGECQVSVKLDWPSNWRKCPLRFASRSYFVPIIVVWIKKLTRNTFYWLFKKGHIVHSNSIQLTVCNTIKTTHFIIPRYRAWTKLYILAWVRGSHKIQVHYLFSPWLHRCPMATNEQREGFTGQPLQNGRRGHHCGILHMFNLFFLSPYSQRSKLAVEETAKHTRNGQREVNTRLDQRINKVEHWTSEVDEQLTQLNNEIDALLEYKVV